MTNLEWVSNSEWVLIKHLLEKPRIIKYIESFSVSGIVLYMTHLTYYEQFYYNLHFTDEETIAQTG